MNAFYLVMSLNPNNIPDGNHFDSITSITLFVTVLEGALAMDISYNVRSSVFFFHFWELIILLPPRNEMRAASNIHIPFLPFASLASKYP